jgi:hypothetical protein
VGRVEKCRPRPAGAERVWIARAFVHLSDLDIEFRAAIESACALKVERPTPDVSREERH